MGTIKRDKNLTGRGLAIAGIVAGFSGLALAIGLMVVVFLSIENFTIDSLSPAPAQPGELLAIKGEGFDRATALRVHLFDTNGYDITLTPAQVTDDAVIIAVPPYLDVERAVFASGTVAVELIREDDNTKTSNTVELAILDLPSFTAQPGTITVQFLQDAIEQIRDTKKHLKALQDLTSGSLSDPELLAALDKLELGYTTFKKEVELAMSTPGRTAQFAQVDGQMLSVDAATLAVTDRLLGSLMQSSVAVLGSKEQIQVMRSSSARVNLFAAPAHSDFAPAITGAASASILTDNCRRLEGLELSVAIACVQKRMSFTEGVLMSAELSNNLYFEKKFAERSIPIVSQLYFLVHVLPEISHAYQEDLDAITAATGKEEHEIAGALRAYYLDKLAGSILDLAFPFAGSAFGAAKDLIIGPPDDSAFRGIRLSEATTRHLVRAAAADEGRLPNKSGLDLIRCGDLCGKVRKDFAVLVGWGGDGSGTISSSPAGISCPGDCTEIYKEGVQQVVLTASSDEGSTFEGWSGACSGKGACVLPFGRDKAVTATFLIEDLREEPPAVAPTQAPLPEYEPVAPTQAPAVASETWVGKFSGKTVEMCHTQSEELSGDYQVTFTVEGSLAAALQADPSNWDLWIDPIDESSGTFSGTETVTAQSTDSQCKIFGASVSNVPILVNAKKDTFLIFSDGFSELLLPGYWEFYPDGRTMGSRGGSGDTLNLYPESISDTVISGTWEATAVREGTFTLTKK